MFPRVILKGTMIKKSQQKKRTSPSNYKERFFVLDTQDLKYSERRPGKKPLIKGCIELSRIKCVEIVCSDGPIPCSYKYPFQIFHDIHYLYVFAPDNDCRQRWVRALKEETKNNNLVSKYHPYFWMDGKWKCCQQTEKLAAGCHVYDPVGYGLYHIIHIDFHHWPNPIICIFKYTLERVVRANLDDDLPLHKDQEYILISSTHPDWWFIQNEQGYEGAFMVRDSRQAGVYTVSVFTKAPGSNGEKNPRVKHYQIRESETEEVAFYLAEKYLFSTIPELILYHQHNAAGLITRLRHPVSKDGGCPQEIEDSSKDQWEVDPEELILGQELGSGQFGLVLEGKWRDRKVAVKMIREECMSNEEFKEEAKVMMHLSHCKLVQLYGVCIQRSPMCLVFEFMENGCLSDYLRAQKGCLSQEVMLGMCLDVSEGMAYLESSNFIHRDLAARNCLVSINNEVKVSDFGMTRYVLDDQYTSSQCSKFPVKWSAPEVIKYCKFSSKSDVWSFGVFMWEVYNEGRLPYENRSNAEVVESLNAGLRLLKPRLAPDSVHLLMEWCWKELPLTLVSNIKYLHYWGQCEENLGS
uniref:Tyrosine-protein kinase n=1 Tax=Mastacembelus armatus TaxID=205130 RepID=A0A7N8WQ54_9TELE